MNYFSYKSAAERYTKGRPHFHHEVIRRIGVSLSLIDPVARAIDIGCGTGLSTMVLKSLAQKVVGVDIAEEMIALAPDDPSISYVVAPAEQLPFARDSFDLMTISQAFHWVSRDDFLAAARRVLRQQGWLVVYDNHFSGQMEENAKFADWVAGYYGREFPSPPRTPVSFGAKDAEKAGFQLLHRETYPNSIKFSLDGLIDYLMTHSNVIAAVEGGTRDADDVRGWLMAGVAPLFEDRAEATCGFNAPIWYLRKGVS